MPHKLGDRIPATGHVLCAELGVDPWRAVGFAACRVDLANLGGERCLSFLACARCTSTGRVIATARHLKRIA